MPQSNQTPQAGYFEVFSTPAANIIITLYVCMQTFFGLYLRKLGDILSAYPINQSS